jgi:hypothetical protein
MKFSIYRFQIQKRVKIPLFDPSFCEYIYIL